MPTISTQQPIRPAEIDLVNQVNTNTGDIETNRKNLAQEAADRTNADTALGNLITEETNARTQADTTLQTNIDNEMTRAKAAENANAQAISQEATGRTNADTALINRITEETNARTQADTTLQTNIDNEMTRAKAAENANAQAISQEAAARTNADTEINGKFPVDTDSIADNSVTTAKIADLTVTNSKLAENAVDTNRIMDKSVTTAKLEDSIQQQLTFLHTLPAMEYGTSSSVNVPANSNATVDIAFESVKTEAPVVLCSLKHASGKIACVVSGITNNQCSIIVYNLTSTDVTGVTVDYLAISGR